jgi:hypothetical protein
MDSYLYPTLNEYLACKVKSAQFKEATMTRLRQEFAKIFVTGESAPSSYVPELREREHEINRVGRLLLAFNLATLVDDDAVAWRPRRKLIIMLEERLALQNSSLTAASSEPKIILDALSQVADVLEFIIAVQSSQKVHRRKSRRPRVNCELRKLIVTMEVRFTRSV